MLVSDYRKHYRHLPYLNYSYPEFIIFRVFYGILLATGWRITIYTKGKDGSETLLQLCTAVFIEST